MATYSLKNFVEKEVVRLLRKIYEGVHIFVIYRPEMHVRAQFSKVF